MRSSVFILFFVFSSSLFAQTDSIDEDLGAVTGSERVKESKEDADEVFSQVEKLNAASGEGVEFKPFIYSERGRRNPFQKPGGLDRQAEVITEDESQLTGLEGYDISSFQLTAVMWDIKHPKALVKAAENEIYSIEEGTRIGRRNGYVAKIREGEIIIVEPSIESDENEMTLYKTQVLKLGR